MKKFILIALGLLQLQFAYGQKSFYQGSINFKQPPYRAKDDVLDFEILNDTAKNNIWQIGRAQKDSFITVKPVMVTDSLNSYPPNTYSFFDLRFYGMNYSPLVTHMEIYHRYITTKSRDGGYILASMDLGKTWINVGDTAGKWNWNNPFYRSLSFSGYTVGDTLPGKIPAFSGSSKGNAYAELDWGIAAVKQGIGDTLTLRFVFQSDSIADNKDGWMIDSIYVLSMWTWGVDEMAKNNIRLYPNPAKDNITVQSLDNHSIQNVTIKDMLGRTFITRAFDGNTASTISVQNLPPGNYLAEIITEKGISIHKIMVE